LYKFKYKNLQVNH